MVDRADEVPPNAEEIENDPVSGEEALCLAWRLEPTHLSLSLPGRLVGNLGSVVRVLPRVVDDRQHGGPVSGAIATELVGHQTGRLRTLALQ